MPENLGVPLQGDRDAGELGGGASRVPSTVSICSFHVLVHLYI